MQLDESPFAQDGENTDCGGDREGRPIWGFELDDLKCHTEAAAIESPIIGTDEMASILRKNKILCGKEFF